MRSVAIRRRTTLAVFAAMTLTATTLAIPASSATAATTVTHKVWCKHNRFTGTKRHMRHWLSWCKHVPYDVVITSSVTKPEAATVVSYNANGVKIGITTFSPDSPDGGGPSCEWLGEGTNPVDGTPHAVVKACYQRGVPHLICAKWWDGGYPYHCGPIEAYSLSHAKSLYKYVRAHESSGSSIGGPAKACLKGTIAGGTAGVIMKVGGAATGWLGLFAGIAGGCVGGLVSYWWK